MPVRRHRKRGSAALHTVGIDEAGRGAVAGPVVAGACILTLKPPRSIAIYDSKQLTPAQRDAAYAWITSHCVWGVGVVPAAAIDAQGILAANERAMQLAVAMVAKYSKHLYLLVDGRDTFWFDFPHSSIVRGDQSEPCIAAASIVAKVTRDRLMLDVHAAFPQYGFDVHKGYGTPRHFAAVVQHGTCAEHRQTFLLHRSR